MSICKNCGEKNPISKGNRKRIYCSKICSNEYYRKTNRYYQKKNEDWGTRGDKTKREKEQRKEEYEAALTAGWVNYLDLAKQYGYNKSRIHYRLRVVLDENDSKRINDGTGGMQSWKRYISPEGAQKLADYDNALREKAEEVRFKKLRIEKEKVEKERERQKRIKERRKQREAERERKRIIREKEAKARKKAKAEERERKKALREEKKRQTRIRHKKKLKSKEWKARCARRRRNLRRDPKVRLRASVGKNVYHVLKRQNRTKNGGKTFDNLSYTPIQLFEHLEAQFDDNMTWDNYGSYWHLDHIIPQAALPYDSLNHPNFKKCWALENLQPLSARDNIIKSSLYKNKYY